MHTTRRLQMLIGTMTAAAACSVAYAGRGSHQLHPYLAPAVLALAVITSRMKVKLPGVNGNMSVNLPFLLTAVASLSAIETVIVACVSTAVQCWPRKGAKVNPQQMTFNISMMAFATCLASLVYHAQSLHAMSWYSTTVSLTAATVTLFVGQTTPVAFIVAASEGKSAGQIWWNVAQLSFPYYVVSVGVTSMVQAVSSHLGWVLALAVFPVMYGIYRSYSLYFGRMAEAPRNEVLVRAASAGA